jgi:hypothetical protein
MNRSFFAICIGLLSLVPFQAAQAGGKKASASVVSFHIETQPEDNPKMIFSQPVNGKVRYFRRTPEISGKDIESFGTFAAEDPTTYGVALHLKNGGRMRLAAVTAANPGLYLLAMVNGRVVDFVLIDRQVEDGCLVIWKGVTLAEIKEFDRSFPRIGAGKDQKKKKWL